MPETINILFAILFALLFALCLVPILYVLSLSIKFCYNLYRIYKVLLLLADKYEI